MTNFCPECGYKLEQDYKFCPNCGNNLKKSSSETKLQKVSAVICKNCGEENPADRYECISCGAVLRPGKPAKRNEKQPARKASPGKTAGEKSLDITKLIAIFAGVIGLALIILIISGVFEDQVPEQTNNPQVPSSGVNLSAIQQINDMEKRVQAEPQNYALLLELAHLKNDNGFFDKAIADYKNYLEKHPENPDARIDMGVCYYNLKQYDTAIDEMKKALEYKPDHQIGHLNLGIVNLAAGRVEESRKWLQKAEALNPGNDIGLKAKELLKNH